MSARTTVVRRVCAPTDWYGIGGAHRHGIRPLAGGANAASISNADLSRVVVAPDCIGFQSGVLMRYQHQWPDDGGFVVLFGDRNLVGLAWARGDGIGLLSAICMVWVSAGGLRLAPGGRDHTEISSWLCSRGVGPAGMANARGYDIAGGTM